MTSLGRSGILRDARQDRQRKLGQNLRCCFIDVTGKGAARVRGTLEKPPSEQNIVHAAVGLRLASPIWKSLLRRPGKSAARRIVAYRARILAGRDNYLTFTAYLDDEYHGSSIALFTSVTVLKSFMTRCGQCLDQVDWGKPSASESLRWRALCGLCR